MKGRLFLQSLNMFIFWCWWNCLVSLLEDYFDSELCVTIGRILCFWILLENCTCWFSCETVYVLVVTIGRILLIWLLLLCFWLLLVNWSCWFTCETVYVLVVTIGRILLFWLLLEDWTCFKCPLNCLFWCWNTLLVKLFSNTFGRVNFLDELFTCVTSYFERIFLHI